MLIFSWSISRLTLERRNKSVTFVDFHQLCQAINTKISGNSNNPESEESVANIILYWFLVKLLVHFCANDIPPFQVTTWFANKLFFTYSCPIAGWPKITQINPLSEMSHKLVSGSLTEGQTRLSRTRVLSPVSQMPTTAKLTTSSKIALLSPCSRMGKRQWYLLHWLATVSWR